MSANRFRAASWIVIATLLFAQLAVTAHACPMASSSDAMVMTPCDEMDEAPSQMCHQHRAQGAQALDQTGSVAVRDVLTLAFVPTVQVAAAVPVSSVAPIPPAFHAAAPRLYIRNRCLRF